jgi:spermidine/putrescine transport system permease protein
MHALFHKLQKTSRLERPFAIGSPALIWQFIFFYLPLILMVMTSLFELSETGSFQKLTFENFRPLFSRAHLNIIFNSLFVAFITACLCLLIAFPLAHFIAFRGKRYKTLLLFFLIVPFWTNFLLHVYAWFFVLERQGFLNNLLRSLNIIDTPVHFLNSTFSVILMMVYCYLPFMVLPIFSSLERFDRYLLEVSHDLGASWSQTFSKVMLPLTLPAVRAGVFLVFIPAFGEFIIPELIGGDRQYLVGNVISQYILGDETEGLGAAFMILSCLSLLVATSGIYLTFKQAAKWLTRGMK